MSPLLHILVTYIKENIIAKLRKLYSPPRNPRVGNKSPLPFVKKPLCMGHLLSWCKIFIEKPVETIRKLCAGQATKKYVGGSTWDAAVHQVKPAVNGKRTLCWAPYMLFVMSMNLHFEAGHAVSKLCTSQVAKTLKQNGMKPKKGGSWWYYL